MNGYIYTCIYIYICACIYYIYVYIYFCFLNCMYVYIYIHIKLPTLEVLLHREPEIQIPHEFLLVQLLGCSELVVKISFPTHQSCIPKPQNLKLKSHIFHDALITMQVHLQSETSPCSHTEAFCVHC